MSEAKKSEESGSDQPTFEQLPPREFTEIEERELEEITSAGLSVEDIKWYGKKLEEEAKKG